MQMFHYNLQQCIMPQCCQHLPFDVLFCIQLSGLRAQLAEACAKARSLETICAEQSEYAYVVLLH